MKHLINIFLLLILLFISSNAIPQHINELKAKALIEVEGDEGKILVFPSPITGPNGPILKFLMFGIYKAPKVVIETITESFCINVTTIDFKEGYLFSGWFQLPEDEIIRIWINDNFINWRPCKE